MPKHAGKHVVLAKGAEAAMVAFKNEITEDLGLGGREWTAMTTGEVGKIGGEMVRRIQAAGEFLVKQRYEKGEERLMPVELLPEMRMISNNGNVQ